LILPGPRPRRRILYVVNRGGVQLRVGRRANRLMRTPGESSLCLAFLPREVQCECDEDTIASNFMLC
jgi:hypothetical protein